MSMNNITGLRKMLSANLTCVGLHMVLIAHGFSVIIIHHQQVIQLAEGSMIVVMSESMVAEIAMTNDFIF